LLINQQGQFLKSKIEYPAENYEILKKEAVKCERCHLCETCKQVVIGEGSLDNKIMLIGEAPGAVEDEKGRPFVGRAGKLLDKVIQAAGIERKNLYITNIVKCRPPKNRKPTIEEAKVCSPILKAEFKIIKPKVIVPLGSTALNQLIDNNASITEARGKWYQKGDFFFLPTFHPAYLLRNKNMKKHFWRDFKLIKKALNRIEELKQKNK